MWRHSLPTARGLTLSFSPEDVSLSVATAQRLAHGRCRDEAAPPRWTRIDEPQPQMEPLSGLRALERKLSEVAVGGLVL
jgi:hypothetical protein